MKIGIIGFGNLGRALADGLLKSGAISPGTDGLYVCDSSQDAQSIAKTGFYARVSDDVNFVFKNADAVFLTVKSYVFDQFAANIDAASLTAAKTVVSFMAGVQLEKLAPHLGTASLVRAMPSLAIASCDGVIGYTKAPEPVAELFSKLGYAFEVEPEAIEKVMAFASCGLGFAAYMIGAFASAGAELGFEPDTAALIAAQTFKNAVERGNFPDTVRAVATPGGATEQGVLHLDSCGVYDIIAGAVRKAYDRMK